MDFFLAQPAALSPWVEAVWYSAGRLTRLRERVLPSASTDIVANLGAPMWMTGNASKGGKEGGKSRRITGTTVTGLMTRPMVLEHPPVHEALGIRLSAHGLLAVLGIPAAAFRDQVVDLDVAIESTVDELVEACEPSTSPRDHVGSAIRWLQKRIARFADVGDPLVQWASSHIEASWGAVSITELQRSSGYGATRFNQRFRDQLGVTPKRYARLVRFRAALDRLDPTVSLSELALDLGFADQAHMNRDFQALAGCSPTRVLRERYVSGLTIAEG